MKALGTLPVQRMTEKTRFIERIIHDQCVGLQVIDSSIAVATCHRNQFLFVRYSSSTHIAIVYKTRREQDIVHFFIASLPTGSKQAVVIYRNS